MATAHFTTGGQAGGQPPGEGEREDDSDDPRRVAHELLGQAHAVLVVATRDDVLRYWCPEDLQQSVKDGRIRLWVAVGDAQAGVGSGVHDQALLDNGIGGLVSRVKRRGLRAALERLMGALTTQDGNRIQAWIRSAAGLARTAVGSLVREIPGGEIIGEALDGIVSGLDTLDAYKADESAPPTSGGPTQDK